MEIKTAKRILNFLSNNKQEFLGLVNENTKKFNPIFTKVYGTLIDDRDLIVDTMKKLETAKKAAFEIIDAWKESETFKYVTTTMESELNQALKGDEKTEEFQERLHDFIEGKESKPRTYNVSYSIEDGNRIADVLRDIESRKNLISKLLMNTKSIIVLRELGRLHAGLTNMIEGFILRNGGYELSSYINSVQNQLQVVDEDLRRLEIQGYDA